MEHPILKNKISGCIMKIQKRSESNVLSKLSINKSIESKRLRKWLIPSTIDDPWSWVKQKIKGHFFAWFTLWYDCHRQSLIFWFAARSTTLRKGRFFLASFSWKNSWNQFLIPLCLVLASIKEVRCTYESRRTAWPDSKATAKYLSDRRLQKQRESIFWLLEWL